MFCHSSSFFVNCITIGSLTMSLKSLLFINSYCLILMPLQKCLMFKKIHRKNFWQVGQESDTTEQLHFHFSLLCTGEGNGNPFQCSCLENPRDRGAWWAAIYGVAQSRTRLKRLSSSSKPLRLCQRVIAAIRNEYTWHLRLGSTFLSVAFFVISFDILACRFILSGCFRLPMDYAYSVYLFVDTGKHPGPQGLP